jgi:hypothetical protein
MNVGKASSPYADGPGTVNLEDLSGCSTFWRGKSARDDGKKPLGEVGRSLSKASWLYRGFTFQVKRPFAPYSACAAPSQIANCKSDMRFAKFGLEIHTGFVYT